MDMYRRDAKHNQSYSIVLQVRWHQCNSQKEQYLIYLDSLFDARQRERRLDFATVECLRKKEHGSAFNKPHKGLWSREIRRQSGRTC
jgi:hypothetical protein